MNLKDLTTKLVCVSYLLILGAWVCVLLWGVCVCTLGCALVTKVGICLISLNSSATKYSETVLICAHQQLPLPRRHAIDKLCHFSFLCAHASFVNNYYLYRQ